ncbi:MAG: DUF5110 domain-containing protein, partial [Prevotella sp.]|nr:DUF5110 domain-containing protein [Prevotella sp.]
NYNYEKGQYSTIVLKWNDRSRTLTIGRRQGAFQGMPTSRTFHVRAVGGKSTATTVQYGGKAMNVKL